MKICDLHAHVLPGVDDGAPTMEYALEMLRGAAASDVEALAVTPHWNEGSWAQDFDLQDLSARFARLQQAACHIPVKLVPGAEVRVSQGLLSQLGKAPLPTINASRYLLTEFPSDTPPEAFQPALEALLDAGYIPLIAHPERYGAVCRAPEQVRSWLDMGCHLQLTGGSILGEYGKAAQQTAACLLRKDLVACVASDAHGIHRRSNCLLEVYDHLHLRYSKHYAQCLLYEIPMGICRNDDL